jgi:hypothetical protein
MTRNPKTISIPQRCDAFENLTVAPGNIAAQTGSRCPSGGRIMALLLRQEHRARVGRRAGIQKCGAWDYRLRASVPVELMVSQLRFFFVGLDCALAGGFGATIFATFALTSSVDVVCRF